jgi:hypothetical protein
MGTDYHYGVVHVYPCSSVLSVVTDCRKVDLVDVFGARQASTRNWGNTTLAAADSVEWPTLALRPESQA